MSNTDARTSCFYARRTLELAVGLLYKHDNSLRLWFRNSEEQGNPNGYAPNNE